MKIKIENLTEYKITLFAMGEEEELFHTKSLQLASLKLRDYAVEYQPYLKEQHELNNSAWLMLRVNNYSTGEWRWIVVCRIGYPSGQDVLWMI